MKSAYELAMERLNQGEAPVKLTDEQKARIAEIDRIYKAKIAERKLFLNGLIAEARAQANYVEIGELETQLAREIPGLEEKCEAEKEKARAT